MKKIITIAAISALLVMLAGGAAYALGFGGGPRLGFENLDLTDEQSAQIDAINEAFRTEVEALREEGREAAREGDRVQMNELREEFFAARAAHRAQLEALLTDEQLDALRSDCGDFRGERRFDAEQKRALGGHGRGMGGLGRGGR